MNKTKAFINRVVIGVTLMTLAACALNQQRQDSYNSQADLMAAQFSQIQYLPGSIEFQDITIQFNASLSNLKSDIYDTDISMEVVISNCDDDIAILQNQLDNAIKISQRTPEEQVDAEAKYRAQRAPQAWDAQITGLIPITAAKTPPSDDAKPASQSSQTPSPQPATPASTAPPEPPKTTAVEDVTGNNITQEIQFMNQGQQGAIIEMPHAG
jgi:hypothetical protein